MRVLFIENSIHIKLVQMFKKKQAYTSPSLKSNIVPITAHLAPSTLKDYF